MKMKTALALGCLLAMAGPSRAQETGDAGVGVILGNPTGATGKLWLSGSQAVDAGIGYSTNLAVYGDYLWHSWSVLPRPSEGKLPAYVGLGLQARVFDETELGIRTVVGVAYWLPRDPVEIFFEIVPVFRVTRTSSVGLDAGLGLRYYFKSLR